MRTIRKNLRTFSFLMTAIILCQSCVVAYHKTPVSLEEAAQKKTRTKILLKDGRVERFNYVYFEDQRYYGTRKTGKGDLRITINESTVNEVRVKNKAATDIINVVMVAIPIVILFREFNRNCCGFNY